jgi:hypothetical protein
MMQTTSWGTGSGGGAPGSAGAMRLRTHNAGGGAAGPEAGACRPRTPGKATRCVCACTALGDAGAVSDAGERERRTPGQAAHCVCGHTALWGGTRDAWGYLAAWRVNSFERTGGRETARPLAKVFSFHQKLFILSYRMFEHTHGALNINKKK